MSKMFEKLKKIALEEFGVKIKEVKRETPLTFESLFGIGDFENIDINNDKGTCYYQSSIDKTIFSGLCLDYYAISGSRQIDSCRYAA